MPFSSGSWLKETKHQTKQIKKLYQSGPKYFYPILQENFVEQNLKYKKKKIMVILLWYLSEGVKNDLSWSDKASGKQMMPPQWY